MMGEPYTIRTRLGWMIRGPEYAPRQPTDSRALLTQKEASTKDGLTVTRGELATETPPPPPKKPQLQTPTKLDTKYHGPLLAERGWCQKRKGAPPAHLTREPHASSCKEGRPQPWTGTRGRRASPE